MLNFTEKTLEIFLILSYDIFMQKSRLFTQYDFLLNLGENSYFTY